MSATRQQRWSRAALECVQKAQARSESAEYRTLCMKLSGLIKQAGLVQALVFLRARPGNAGTQLVEDVSAVMGHKDTLLPTAQKAELPQYLALTNDVSQVALWFRRFAQIELEKKE